MIVLDQFHIDRGAETTRLYRAGERLIYSLSEFAELGLKALIPGGSIKNIYWDESFKIYTDFSFIIPCILSGLKHSYSGKHEVDYFYRKTPSANAMTSSFISDEKCESTVRLFERTLNSLEEREDRNKRKNQFKKFLSLHFKRLLKNPNRRNIDEFIALLGLHYDRFFVFRYSLVSFLSTVLGYNRIIAKIIDL